MGGGTGGGGGFESGLLFEAPPPGIFCRKLPLFSASRCCGFNLWFMLGWRCLSVSSLMVTPWPAIISEVSVKIK